MKLIGYAVTGLLALVGMFAVNRCTDQSNAAEIALWKAKKVSADSVVQVKDSLLAEANARNATSDTIYLHDRVLISDRAKNTPAAPLVAACFEAADKRISACEAARAAADSVIGALRHDLKVTEARPEKREKRFQMYGAAGYSATVLEEEKRDNVVVRERVSRFSPAIRAGIDSKLIGPIRIATDGQLTLPGRGQAALMWQANAMLKINF